MTRAACRATTVALAALAATMLSLALLAGPARATEGEEATSGEPAEEASGFGSGQWDGLLLTAVAGLVVGGVVFAMSSPGQIKGADAHH